MKFNYILKTISREKTTKYLWFPILNFIFSNQNYNFPLFNAIKICSFAIFNSAVLVKFFFSVNCCFNTVKPLNSGHLRVLKNLSVDRCPLLGGNLKKIVTSGTKCFVRYSWYVRYFGCLVLGGFTVTLSHFESDNFLKQGNRGKAVTHLFPWNFKTCTLDLMLTEVFSFKNSLFRSSFVSTEMECCLTHFFHHVPILYPLTTSEKRCFQKEHSEGETFLYPLFTIWKRFWQIRLNHVPEAFLR